MLRWHDFPREGGVLGNQEEKSDSGAGGFTGGLATVEAAVGAEAVAGGGSWPFLPLSRPRAVDWVFFMFGTLLGVMLL